MIDFATMLKVDEVDVAGKRVLVRIDLDVPVRGGQITDDTLIRKALPTIESLVEKNARVILMSRLGDPKGKVRPELSLEPVAMRLAELLPSGEVILTDSCVGGGAKRVSLDLRDGQVAVLENLGFHTGEATNDDKFSRELSALADVYVAETFRVLHETHASTVGVLKYFSKRAVGNQLAQEIASYEHLLKKVERPYVAIIGGASFSKKIGVIQALLESVDTLIVGGGVANTFVAATQGPMGKSPVESSKYPLCRNLVAKAKTSGKRILLPSDFIVSDPDNPTDTQNVTLDTIPSHMSVCDIGDQSRSSIKEVISRAGAVFWSGPMGIYEQEPSRAGTLFVARAISGSAAFSVVTGDHSVQAVTEFGLEKGFNHISNGEDAALQLIEGKVLPGIEALKKR